MIPKVLPFAAMLGAAVLGIVALLSGELLLQLLGGLAILVALGAGISEAQMDKALRTPPPLEERRGQADPARSILGDRIYALVFIAATVILVIALAIYTAWQLYLF
jgi:hypothetical protein